MKRNQWTKEQKFKIVLEGLQSDLSVGELCSKHEVHQSQYYAWREQFFREGAKMFESSKASKREEQLNKKIAKMQRVIGELTLELKKND